MTTTVDTHLNLSEEIKNEAIHNSAFNDFIREIEKRILEYGKKIKIKTESKVYLEDDWEEPNYTKVILLINFEGIPFETELKLWKELNDVIYKKINLIIYKAPEPLAKELESIKKRFFIKLDLN